MKYAVGMIVLIRRAEGQLAGVIIGWQHKEFESLKSCNLTLEEVSILE